MIDTSPSRQRHERTAPSEGAVATKAVLRAAARLDLTNRVLSRILGVSEATVSRMGSGSYVLAPDEKPFEIALLVLRLFRSLDAITDGDESVARAWLRHENAGLGGVPLTLVQSVHGLVHALNYLDARRSLA